MSKHGAAGCRGAAGVSLTPFYDAIFGGKDSKEECAQVQWRRRLARRQGKTASCILHQGADGSASMWEASRASRPLDCWTRTSATAELRGSERRRGQRITARAQCHAQQRGCRGSELGVQPCHRAHTQWLRGAAVSNPHVHTAPPIRRPPPHLPYPPPLTPSVAEVALNWPSPILYNRSVAAPGARPGHHRTQSQPRQQQDWILKCLQGGRAYPLAACAVATLCSSPARRKPTP